MGSGSVTGIISGVSSYSSISFLVSSALAGAV